MRDLVGKLTGSENANVKVNLSDIGFSPPWNPAVVILSPGRLFSDPEELFIAVKKIVGSTGDQHGALLCKNRTTKASSAQTEILCKDLIAILLDPITRLSAPAVAAAIQDVLSCTFHWKVESSTSVNSSISRSEFKVIALGDETIFVGDIIRCELLPTNGKCFKGRAEPEADKSFCSIVSPFLRSLKYSPLWVGEVSSLSEWAPHLYAYLTNDHF